MGKSSLVAIGESVSVALLITWLTCGDRTVK
jgi:hypothetical protein